MIYTYSDAYLSKLMDDERETAAVSDVAELGTLPAQWVSRLVVLRAYVKLCLDSHRAPGDVFEAKLAAYRKEWSESLTQAKLAQAMVDAVAGNKTGGGSFFTVGLERC